MRLNESESKLIDSYLFLKLMNIIQCFIFGDFYCPHETSIKPLPPII